MWDGRGDGEIGRTVEFIFRFREPFLGVVSGDIASNTSSLSGHLLQHSLGSTKRLI